MIFHFRLFPRKTNDKIFSKMQQTPFWAHFVHLLGKQNFPSRFQATLVSKKAGGPKKKRILFKPPGAQNRNVHMTEHFKLKTEGLKVFKFS